MHASSYLDVELYINETQSGNQMETVNQITLVCNASNFNVDVIGIMFFGPNKLKQMCPKPPSTESTFSDGTVIRAGQTCILKILRPSLAYGGVYYCQVQPVGETCLNFTSDEVEVLLTNDHTHDYFHAFEGALVAVFFVSFALFVLLIALTYRVYKLGRRERQTNQGVPVDCATIVCLESAHGCLIVTHCIYMCGYLS